MKLTNSYNGPFVCKAGLEDNLEDKIVAKDKGLDMS